MPVALSRKRKSPEPDRDTYNEENVTTPTGSPARKKLRITQTQKQTLIDNLQLEITERARKLRAQYALQAQDLKARIERRVNRIPISLRKTTMGVLLEKYQAQPPKKAAVSTKANKNATTTVIPKDVEYPNIATIASPSRYAPQTSNVGSYSDKENAPVQDAHVPLENPKKRGNPNATGQPRSVSQVLRDAESKVLSPKSSNSRTYKQSPLITSPTKSSYLSRPASPLKPSSPLKAMIEDARARTMRPETRKASPAAGRKTKTTTQTRKTTTKSSKPVAAKSPARPATRQQDRHTSTSTTLSNMSAGTTIVKPTRTATAKRATATTSSAAAKRTAVARSQGPTAAATAKRTAAAAKKAAMEAPVSNTGRVLRKRA
ncbi:Borealin N terminal-domain-containing protein [Talaromyces proteolyticus]|uniref:Borealin N terminal-domain-containing protein n=1 Tax=Talaromyces proteolyticus TaxID=1131652 RepID=A0AAD4PU99_9EURO|nr:Borealin N terminal-domain-containing protein [Talaromyces proteolyticus]KAH8692005.1 Borealin N terminal-domain-containing protein [Talaromyces proteolyticus]